MGFTSHSTKSLAAANTTVGDLSALEFLVLGPGDHTSVTGPVLSEMEKSVHHQTPLRKSWFALTLSTLTFAFAVKLACMFSNFVFAVSPIPQVREFNKTGDTGLFDAAPFISILYGGCQWCFYGFFAYEVTQKSGFLVLVYSNIWGAICGCYYVWGFWRNCQNEWSLQKLRKYIQAVSVVVFMQLFAVLALSRRRALLFSGLASSICSVVGASSLLSTMPLVLESKCSATINFPLTVVGFFSTILWLVCGFMLWDAWIMLPNICNLACYSLTLSLALYFPRELKVPAPKVPAPMADTAVPRPTGLAALGAALGAEDDQCYGETGGSW